ncbi:MAG: hypothetical protein LBR30_01685 [Clostridioides sp.]|jgi:hypothetical protein|nr:hypothetical protein [Clostridioides sp.]
MSIKESNLAKYKDFNTDMTVSIKESSLNSQLRQYLALMSQSKTPWKSRLYVIQTYVDNKPTTIYVDTNTKREDFPKNCDPDFIAIVNDLYYNGSSLYKELDKLNIFNIPNETKASYTRRYLDGSPEEILQRAINYSLFFAIEVEDGLPNSILQQLINGERTPDEIYKPITLNKYGKVTFEQCFKNFNMIKIIYGPSRADLLNNSQTDEKIFRFINQIPLDFTATSYKELKGKDNAIEKTIRNITGMSVINDDDIDNIFNISQLALDIAKLQVTSYPRIEVNEIHEADETLDAVVKAYFDRLEEAGQTVFGHVVLPKSISRENYLFRPKMKNFNVGNGYLNYLIGMGEETTIPTLGNIDSTMSWNTGSLIPSTVSADGVMAISSEFFLPHIFSYFQPLINPNINGVRNENSLARVINATLKYNAFNCSGTLSTCSSDIPQNFTVNYENNGAFKNITWNYEYETTAGRNYKFGDFYTLRFRNNYTCDAIGTFKTVKFEKYPSDLPSFSISFRVKNLFAVWFDDAKNQGYTFDKTATIDLGIVIDSNGNLSFPSQINIVNNNPGGVSYSDKCKIFSGGFIVKFGNDITGIINRFVAQAFDQPFEHFKKFDKVAGWVMPGCKTFTFKYDTSNNTVNAISDFGDLYAFINYVQEQYK